MRFLAALLGALLIPLLALIVALMPAWLDEGIRDPGILFALSRDLFAGTASASDAMTWLVRGSVVTGALGVAIILIVKFTALGVGWNRSLLAFAFPVVAFLSLLGTGIAALGQAGLLAGSIWVLEAQLIGQVHLWAVGLVGLLAGGAALGVLSSALHMFKRAETSVVGLPIRPIDAPHLHRIVGNIARKFKTSPPDNIVLGFDASFFATSARVNVPFAEKPLKGETLYLSLPMMRMLSEGETRSIIGHEMGHFSGGDTVYSKRFAPAFRGLTAAIEKSHDEDGKGSWLGAPSRFMLRYIVACFSHPERRISRLRETRADQMGAEAGSAEDLGRALLKFSMLANIWNVEFDDMVARVKLGRFSRNLSKNFVERAKYDIDHDKLSGLAALSLDSEIAHPTDAHPLTRDRMVDLGLDPETYADIDTLKANLFPDKTIISAADSFERIEEQITDAWQQIMVHHVEVDESDNVKSFNSFSNLLSMFLAKMVVIDGHVDDREIEIAQEEAFKYDQAFDPVSFREYCRHPEDIPTREKLIYWGNLMLNPQGAARLREILRKIASADGELHEKETELMNTLDEQLEGGTEEEESEA